MKIQLLGAAGTVTGSRALVETDRARVLVDCGLFQGFKSSRLRNWEPFPVDPASVDAVVLTHAHLDHSGWLPRLVKDGFRGPVWCTEGTRDLCRLLLPDSASLQEEDARYANKKGFSRHKPALPLYTAEEAERALARLKLVAWDEERPLAGDLRLRLLPAGHILGAGMAWITDGKKSVLFSGDLGRPNDLIMPPPRPAPAADLLVMESTYGDRRHPEEDPLVGLAEELRAVARREGVLLVPSFAVGRAQTLLLALDRVWDAGDAPRLPVYLDSPMAEDATALYVHHRAEHHLGQNELAALSREVRFVRSADESRALNDKKGPFVLLSASGMLTGGRVLHHLKQRASDSKNTLLFVGYQAPGTRGARILDGEREIKIHGRYARINCHIRKVDGFSAHADQQELLDWLRAAERPPGRVLLNHGEPAACDALRVRVQDELGLTVRAARDGERVELD